MMLFSPRWLFLYPGFIMFLTGLLIMAWLLPQPRKIAGITFDIHTLFYGSLAMVVGFQSMLFWIFVKIYGAREGIVPADPWFRSVSSVLTLEAGLVAGAVLLLVGLGLGVFALTWWTDEHFGQLSATEVMRLVIPSGTSILLAFQTAYGAFFVSVLEIRATRSALSGTPRSF